VIPVHFVINRPFSLGHQQCFRWRVSPSGSSTVPARICIRIKIGFIQTLGESPLTLFVPSSKVETAILLLGATAQCDCFDRHTDRTKLREKVLKFGLVSLKLFTSAGMRSRVFFSCTSVRSARGFSLPVRHCLNYPPSKLIVQLFFFIWR
jgi:hypothetical protein